MAHVSECGVCFTEGVIQLRESPEIMVTQDIGIILEIGPNSNLVVKCLTIIVPHFLQPIEAKQGFICEIRGTCTGPHLFRKSSYAVFCLKKKKKFCLYR